MTRDTDFERWVNKITPLSQARETLRKILTGEKPMIGTITEWNPNTLIGVVKCRTRSFRFHSTSFQSDTCFRWPRLNERVEVVLTTHGELLSVHGA